MALVVGSSTLLCDNSYSQTASEERGTTVSTGASSATFSAVVGFENIGSDREQRSRRRGVRFLRCPTYVRTFTCVLCSALCKIRYLHLSGSRSGFWYQ